MNNSVQKLNEKFQIGVKIYDSKYSEKDEKFEDLYVVVIRDDEYDGRRSSGKGKPASFILVFYKEGPLGYQPNEEESS
jgi:hypothetical protein